MSRIITVNLPSFIRSVRAAQGITQKGLAEDIKITQSAITQYENEVAVLSKEKLREIAPYLNLNPEFIDLGNGNPFKQRDRHKILMMYFPQTSSGGIDYSIILRQILQYNDLALFLFLKPSESTDDSLRARRWRAKGLSSYALVIQDQDNNVFIFKRKDDGFFNEKDLLLLIEQEEARQKSFDVHHVILQVELYKDIRKWHFTNRQIESLLRDYKVNDSRIFLKELFRRSRPFRRSSGDSDQDKLSLLNTIFAMEGIGPVHAENLLNALLPDIYDLLKKHLRETRTK